MVQAPPNATQMLRAPGSPAPRRWPGTAAVVLLAALIGALVGGALQWSGPPFVAQAEILVTGVGSPDNNDLYAIGQYELDRAATWAVVAESATVAEAAAAVLGEPPEALEDAVHAEAPTAQTLIRLSVDGETPEQAVQRAVAVADAAAAEIDAQEQIAGMPYPRADAAVISVPTDAENARWLDVRYGVVIGTVVGLLIGWLVRSIRHPGAWFSRLSRPLDAPGQQDQLTRIDQSVQLEVLGALLLGQSWRGVAIAVIALAGVFGFAFTGSAFPPLIVVVLAGIAGRKDLRFAAGGIVYAGATVLPAKIELVDLGLFTPTVLEVAVGIGLVLTFLQWRRDPHERGVFDAPVVAITGAILLGCAVSLANGTGQSDVVDTARSLLIILAFFVVRRAFRGQPHHLFAVMLITAAAAAVVALIAVGVGLETLNPQSADYVVTGSETAEVSRINTPALELWSPLLVVLAAGVVRLRPRWLWAIVLLPCLALQGLSFDRTTWATLIALAVVVAVLRGGRNGLLLRAGALIVIGAIGIAALSAGAFGPEGQAVALRLTSVVTGQALQENSLTDRLEENIAARETLRDSPFTGTGIGAYYGAELVTYDDNRGVLNPDPRPWIHNQYYRIWLWMGVAGLLAYGFVAVRVAAMSFHSWKRRGQAATTTVAAAAGLASIAAQAVFATNLDFSATIISVGVVLALMESSGTERRPVVASPSPDRVRSPSSGMGR